ncbi:IS66 family transposase, partial [Pseudonocardia nigra]|uniref:IS66 family transposase n=1 Tax=Pseudonocardia nigra TaxID=1921578 RepID=UPI001C5FDAF7
ETLTAYHLHPSRGRAAVTEFDVLPAFRGTVVHDALAVYDAYPDARHALCGAHLARELVAAAEATPTRTGPNRPSGRCTGSTLPPTMPASSDNTRSRRRSPNRY